MKRKKLGVLTFHKCINYGSYWQARCLVEGLRTKGFDAEILDHDSRRINIAEWKCAYEPLLPKRVDAAAHPLYREKIKRFFMAFEQLPLSPRFNIDAPASMAMYDTVIVGSDEVWNLFHPWYGKHPVFFGSGLKTNNIISYAASFGNYAATTGLGTQWINYLQKFSSISVRDYNSQFIIRKALGIDPSVVLDPCLVFPDNCEHREIKHNNYIAVYGHSFSDTFIQNVKAYAKSRQRKLVSIGYHNHWADEQFITADPMDFVNFIRNAQAVVTNFFHGCVFAISKCKPFVCEGSGYRNLKILSLLENVGATQHMVHVDSPIDHYYDHLDKKLSDEVLLNVTTMRRTSSAFLDAALAAQYEYA